jgi:hypothetical protein
MPSNRFFPSFHAQEKFGVIFTITFLVASSRSSRPGGCVANLGSARKGSA